MSRQSGWVWCCVTWASHLPCLFLTVPACLMGTTGTRASHSKHTVRWAATVVLLLRPPRSSQALELQSCKAWLCVGCVAVPPLGERHLGPGWPTCPSPGLPFSTPAGTQSCPIQQTGCTSMPPTVRSPRQPSWTASPSTSKTTSMRPPSWQLTTVRPAPRSWAVGKAGLVREVVQTPADTVSQGLVAQPRPPAGRPFIHPELP